MTPTLNPQTADDRAKYRRMTDQLGHLGLDTAVPESVRALAEKSVAQTRQAYDRSLDTFDTSLTTFERTFDAAGQDAIAFNRKIVDIARRNVSASFDLAASLAGAKNLAVPLERNPHRHLHAGAGFAERRPLPAGAQRPADVRHGVE